MTKVAPLAGYNAYTKAGNPYNRTKTGKKVGVVIGGIGTAVSVASYSFLAKMIRNEGQSVLNALKDLVVGSKGLVVARAFKPLANAFLIGAAIDLCVNAVRRHKANKAAKQV